MQLLHSTLIFIDFFALKGFPPAECYSTSEENWTDLPETGIDCSIHQQVDRTTTNPGSSFEISVILN